MLRRRVVSPVHVLDDESTREVEVDDLERCARDDDGQSGLPRAGILLSEFCKSRAEHCLPVNYCARPLRPSTKMQQRTAAEEEGGACRPACRRGWGGVAAAWEVGEWGAPRPAKQE